MEFNEREKSNMVACFIGHRKTSINKTFILRLENCITKLITCDNVDTFLFGSRSEFDDICLQTVTEFKKNYPHIKRVYVWSSYPYIDSSYERYLLNFYDATYIPDNVSRRARRVKTLKPS